MASTPPQTEKPFHYTYLKEFRVNQCPLFLQHKCTQHRPFTCFHWHFSNQRRRRPMRRRDGTFNYSADVYCSKYDETTGICPDGDDCPFIHRNTGDTERRYHLRYYKTGTCIHETDSRGNCVKNGPHCAFAHGANDLRPPVYDIREQQNPDQPTLQNHGLTELAKTEPVNLGEKIVNDDPKWLEANYVLANYKTEVCKRPPRLCRQGYACPQYHNLKDRRRNPKKFKYRSTPCPNVKQGDDWKDPSCCEKGDSCQFCHTRTEQQFYPEIYKSTKCHDMTQTGYCPRGPFCAFAHVEQEIRMVEGGDTLQASGDWKDITDNASIFSASTIAQRPSPTDKVMSSSYNQVWGGFEFNSDEIGRIIPQPSQSFNDDYNMSKSFPSCPSPLNPKPRSSSISSAKNENLYSKAPGSERNSVESFIRPENGSFGSIGNNVSWPQTIKSTMGGFSSIASSPPSNRMKQLNLLNTEAQPFYPPDETVDSVVGNALDDKESEKLRQNLTSNFWNTTSMANDDSLFPMSDPVNIPSEQAMKSSHDSIGMFPSASSPTQPLGFEFSNSVSSAIATGRYRTTSQTIGTPGSQPGSLLMSASLGSGLGLDLERMQRKCKQWEESWNQAKSACDAWKQEATLANKRARFSEEQAEAIQERCRLLENNLKALLEQKDPESVTSSQCQFLHEHCNKEDLKKLSVVALQQIQSKYKSDLDTVEKVIWELLWRPQN